MKQLGVSLKVFDIKENPQLCLTIKEQEILQCDCFFLSFLMHGVENNNSQR